MVDHCNCSCPIRWDPLTVETHCRLALSKEELVESMPSGVTLRVLYHTAAWWSMISATNCSWRQYDLRQTRREAQTLEDIMPIEDRKGAPDTWSQEVAPGRHSLGEIKKSPRRARTNNVFSPASLA